MDTATYYVVLGYVCACVHVLMFVGKCMRMCSHAYTHMHMKVRRQPQVYFLRYCLSTFVFLWICACLLQLKMNIRYLFQLLFTS